MNLEDGLLQKPSFLSGFSVQSPRSPEPQVITSEHHQMLSMLFGPSSRCCPSFNSSSDLLLNLNFPGGSSSFNVIRQADGHRLETQIQKSVSMPAGAHPFSARVIALANVVSSQASPLISATPASQTY